MKESFFICSLVFISLILQSCAKDTVEPEYFGDIEGIIIDSETGEGIPKVSITTAPATNSILSEDNGEFVLRNIPTSNYTIFAKKNDYTNTSVSVAVRENQTAIANIVMVMFSEDDIITKDDLEAEIISWYNRQSGDSSYVEVEYKVSNISENKDIAEYEIYFEIQTDGDTYYVEESGTDLRSGQSNFIEFTKYIRQNTAHDVFIFEVWLPSQ